MRRAILRVYPTLDITLKWMMLPMGLPGWRTVRYWSCLPGYLGADHGYWTEHALKQLIKLYDEDDDQIATVLGMEISWVGYPFDGLKGANFYGFHKVHKGGALPGLSTWELVEV